MKASFFLSFIFLIIPCIIIGQHGNIKGIIIDDNGISLSGATIYIKSVNEGTVSDLNGKFIFTNIPEGNYILEIEYLGFSNKKKETKVTANTTVSVSIILNSESIQLQNVHITAFGATIKPKALNTQRNNTNSSNVVSTDQIGKFPDANIGDALKRIPGITMQVNQGEARYIIVRGLAPELNSVSLNGSRIPSAEGDNRRVQMDLIPSDMIQLVEVHKTLTPDMDADALGGSINLITRTTPEGFRASATLGSGINTINNKRILDGSFLLGDRSKNNKLGWMVSALINDNYFASDAIEAVWVDSFEYNTGITDNTGAPVIETLSVNPYTSVLEIQTHTIQRIRRSFAVNFDYRFNNDHDLFLKTMYNWRDDRENRFVFEHEILAGEDIELDHFTLIDDNLTQFPAEVSRQTRGGINNNRNKKARLEDLRMQNYSLGGNHLLNKIKLDWLLSFAKASDKKNNERTAEFKSEYIVNNNLSLKFPLLSAINSTDENDLESFFYEEIVEENRFTKEEDFNAFINLKFDSNLFGKGNGFVKLGLRNRLKFKERENNFLSFNLQSNFPTLADVPTQNYSNSNFLVGSQYEAGYFATKDWLGNLALTGGEGVPDEFLRQNFNLRENVYAAYIMVNQKLSNKLIIIAGTRVEHTFIKSTANQIENLDEAVGQITNKKSYTNILPSVHFKYNASPQTIFRCSWTNSFSRPNYKDLVPLLDIAFSDEEIVVGNPNLKPIISTNFDLSGEHYFKSVGIISANVFLKHIKDFIYTFKSQTTNDTYGTGTSGFSLFKPLNGDKAKLLGFEIALQRKLNFLPGFAKNLYIDFNYTHLSSSAKGIHNADGDERNDLNLPNAAPNIYNLSLGYETKKISLRVSANFSEAYIDEIGKNSFEDIYYDKQFFIDFNGSYKLSKNFNLYASINNITNQSLRFYQGNSQRTAKDEYYKTRITFGIKYDIFIKKTQ